MSSPYVADNERVKMKDVLDALCEQGELDVCTAFVDAYGIACLQGAAEAGDSRLLVGYELADMPQTKDIATFEMADEWKRTGADPVQRIRDDEAVRAAIHTLDEPGLQVAKTTTLTHSKLYVSPHMGVAGSSNLTRAGIEGQRELNLLHDYPETVARLREWFDAIWRESKDAERSDFKQELKDWISNTRFEQYAPFHPYAKAIYERYRHRFVSLAARESDINLAAFQQEGRETSLGILAEHKCCIIADAVGLGKTYIALGAMQQRSRSRKRSQKKILVICPAQLEGVWERAGHNQGIMLHTESMETLGRNGEDAVDRRLEELGEYALVIVDEAHNFRNPNANRFQNLMRVLQGGPEDKEVLMLTATPINNSVGDLYSLYRLMTRDRDDFFLTTNLGIRSLQDFFKSVEKGVASVTDLLLETMVCRSRVDIRRRQENGEVIIINDKEVRFPDRRLITLEYSLGADGVQVDYDQISLAIENLTLGAYNVEQYSKNPDNAQNQTLMRLQTLFKMLLLKRLESSVVSFVSTAEKLLDFSDKVLSMLQKGLQLTADEYRKLQLDFSSQLMDDDEGEASDSAYLKNLQEKDASQYDVARLAADVEQDHDLLNPLIASARRLMGRDDGKLQRLKKELRERLPNEKVLLFTFYSDTAEYLHRELTGDEEFMRAIGIKRIEVIVGGVKGAQKSAMVQDFAPKANDVLSEPARPIQCLISTDVLSEGQNLQDCGFLINYDLHFNPVRMIQRNGRIDRLFSEHKEITISNFFPEGGLEAQLGIVERLQNKIATIQENMPVDSSVIGEKVRIFSLEELRKTRQGDIAVLEAIDAENPVNRFHDMLNEVIKMLQEFGIEDINRIPYGCQSNKRSTHRGVFICVLAGKTEDPHACWWLYYPLEAGAAQSLFPEPVQEPSGIIEMIRSQRPEHDSESHPDFQPREIRWDIILDAKQRAREMLLQQGRDAAVGQKWAKTHINHRLKLFFAPLQDGLSADIEARLGRFSLERDKAEVEPLLREAKETGNAVPLRDWLEENLPKLKATRENLQTMLLTVVSYMELVPG
jgi:superfamily II DNA or RNA helicase